MLTPLPLQLLQLACMHAVGAGASFAPAHVHAITTQQPKYMLVLPTAHRAQVDGLRRGRLLFEDVLRKAERAWAEKRANMVTLIQATATAHEGRQKVRDACHGPSLVKPKMC